MPCPCFCQFDTECIDVVSITFLWKFRSLGTGIRALDCLISIGVGVGGHTLQPFQMRSCVSESCSNLLFTASGTVLSGQRCIGRHRVPAVGDCVIVEIHALDNVCHSDYPLELSDQSAFVVPNFPVASQPLI
jgi:hypothetical protein